MSNRVGFISLGCPKALVDSERILTQLKTEGYDLVATYDLADLVIVNTCGFIDAAKAESLQAIGEAFLDMLYHDDSLQLMRLISAVGAQDQTMANLFYEAGPVRTRSEMIRFLNRAVDLGLMQVPDPERASEVFFGMLQGGCTHIQIIIGCAEPPSREEIAQHVTEVVRVFMRAYQSA